MNSGHHSLPGIVYIMFNSSEQSWTTKIKQILLETGYGFVWLNQNVANEKKINVGSALEIVEHTVPNAMNIVIIFSEYVTCLGTEICMLQISS